MLIPNFATYLSPKVDSFWEKKNPLLGSPKRKTSKHSIYFGHFGALPVNWSYSLQCHFSENRLVFHNIVKRTLKVWYIVRKMAPYLVKFANFENKKLGTGNKTIKNQQQAVLTTWCRMIYSTKCMKAATLHLFLDDI